ncbi:PAS domain-containing protein [Mesorhizobium sp. WSM4303]|uniref:PAS domain-containing protein n=2 Tax=unclassified Mesorhizobium TaxID=325217 RepID=UPI0032B1B6D2
MLQLFLAISASSALIVAAISRQHQVAVLTLRQSVEALRDRERELSQLVNLVPSHVWRLTPAGEPNFINKRLSDFLGLDVVDYDQPGMSRLAAAIATSAHPEDAPGIQEAIGHSLATGKPFSMTWRVRRADGVYRWVESRAEPLRDDAGAILHWYGVNVDIDDQVTAQQALRDRERELAQLVDMVPVQIRRLTPEGEPTFFNKRLLDFFGLHDVAQLEKPDMSRLAAAIQTLVHPEDAARLLKTVRHSLATGEPYAMKYRMRRADGAYRWVDGRGEPVRDHGGAIVQWYAISIDIDDEMRAQEALRDRERELRQLIDAVPALIWSTTPEGTPSYINKPLMDTVGVTLEDLTAPDSSRSLADVHPDDRPVVEQALARSFEAGTAFARTYRQRRSGGGYRWTEGRAEPLRDESGSIVQWYGVCVDIHDLATAQEALRERERFLWQLVETLPIMIDCAAPDGEPMYRSRQLREFLGYELEELDGTGKGRLAGTLDAGVHPDDVADVKESYARSLATGEPYARKHRLRRFDGEYRWVDTRAAPMRNSEGAIIQWNVTCLDIDGQVRAQEELRLAQERLARASQAASLAELSASIAHEVNQPLAAVVANSHACQRWLMAEPPNLERAQKTVERIIRDANSAADVVSRIRALFKQSVETRTRTTLGSVIAEALNLVAEEAVRRRVRLDVDVNRDLPLVALDRVHIQQVLVNLIRNGMDAMESVAHDRVLGLRVRARGDVVQTEISDRGLGVASPERIFEPFFTTKENGMGMGLAICRSIVESHGGRLWVEKNEPHGATFIFTLPAEVKATA